MPIPEGYSSPVRLSAKEKAFNQLQRWIIDGTLLPGEKIYDAEIAEALGVSRTPIREALQLLQMQGFVEMHPGKETRVTSLTREDVLKIYPPLASLQALAAEIAASKVTEKQIDELKKINADYKKAIQNEEPFKALELDEQFHAVIVEIAENPYISDFSSILQLHIRRLKYVFLKQKMTGKDESLHEHQKMLTSFQERNGKAASSYMKQNWLRPMQEVYNLLK
ncbi:GntR family transcriptional regulator [Pseudalkalibacillus caeni]|uniref:GntR family transcriptional regulator n=1 Tax=Exobacillus caeni TaxID=2574798 RepID=A0A5R9FC57_9BACL|nr:GntR family transcriptional regulator [Pseudalkalibacillus caeni]TLS37235.1 GntR family transcriptional regulator [Pseudalkalibacillus caeni]